MRWMTAAVALALTGPATYSFEKDAADKAPEGFVFSQSAGAPPGRWEVKTDGGNKILAQLDPSQTKTRFAMAVVKDSSYKDVALSVRGKPISGKVDQSVGLVWRYKDANNYYLARTNALEQNVSFYRVVDGKRKELDGKDSVAIKTGEWQTLKVEHRGEQIAVFYNDQKLFETQDKTFPDAGKVGLWIKADSVSYFDDLTVEEVK